MNWKYWVLLASQNPVIQSCYEVDGTSHCSEKIPLESHILSHAIGNKFRQASAILIVFRLINLRTTFEAPDRQRLLMSFAHRYWLLHSHAVAKEIVEVLQPEGAALEKNNRPRWCIDTHLNYIAPASLWAFAWEDWRNALLRLIWAFLNHATTHNEQ